MPEIENQRSEIAELEISGELWAIEDLVPYKNGRGYLRKVVVREPGSDPDTPTGRHREPAYVPITLFGEDAVEVDPDKDRLRKITCLGRLESFQYLGRDGARHLSLAIPASRVRLGTRIDTGVVKPEVQADEDNDDIPF